MDLATTMAACIEQAGLNPVLVLCEGHAFPGLISDDRQLPEILVTNADAIATLIESGAVVPAETVSVTHDEGISFDRARTATQHYWSTHLDSVVCMIDVRSAHRCVRPLPVVRRSDGDSLIVEVERPPEPRLPTPSTEPVPTAEEAGPRGGRQVSARAPARVERWKGSLLDLTLRNPLLNHRTGSRSTGLDLHVPVGSLGRIEDLIHSGVRLRLVPHDQIADIHVRAGARTAQDIAADQLAAILEGERGLFVATTQGSYASRMRAIQRKARTVVEETGANNLFLALGSLLWDDNGRPCRAPLFLMPVSLSGGRRGQLFGIQIDEGGYAAPNECLLEKLRVTHDLHVPAFAEPEVDDSGIDLAGALQRIRLALVEAGLPYRVDETAHLAVLQFSTLQLWQDLNENWATFLVNPVVRHLVESPTESFVDPAVRSDASASPIDAEALTWCPIPTDGSQLEAVRWAADGRSFVLEGPPGTGMSQTITNLVAHSLAEGRTVLFVAEKQAALEVVKARLAKVGLGPFCLDLHGKDQSPAAVREQLKEALYQSVEGGAETWDALVSQYRTLVASLAQYPRALHENGPAGQNAWTARQVLVALGKGEAADVPLSVVSGQHDVEGCTERPGRWERQWLPWVPRAFGTRGACWATYRSRRSIDPRSVPQSVTSMMNTDGLAATR